MSGTLFLDTIQASIVGAGVGQKTASKDDWMVYKGAMPDATPEGQTVTVASRAICLYEGPGMPPLERWIAAYPGLQVVVRGGPDDYTATRNKAQQIFEQLHANEAALDASFVYLYATHSGPLSMGLDEKRRIKLAWNFRAMRNKL